MFIFHILFVVKNKNYGRYTDRQVTAVQFSLVEFSSCGIKEPLVIYIRPHRPHYVYAAYCYRPSSVVCPSVSLSVTLVSPANPVEPIEMLFRLWTRMGQRKHKFNRISQVAPMCAHGMAHWRHQANYDWTVRLRRRCGLMSNYFDHLLLFLLQTIQRNWL